MPPGTKRSANVERPGHMRRAVLVVLSMFVAVAPTAVPRAAVAQAADTVLLERLTWTEIRDAVQRGTTTIIIPAGGTEQSGPFIAVGKHNVRVAVLSERIARALGNALVAPVLAYVPEGTTQPTSSHMRFPGTITVPDGVFEQTLESAAESFRAHGFRTVVLLGDHGGYQSNLKAVAGRLNRRWPPGARALYVPEYYAALETFAQDLKARGFGPDVGEHADIRDTSLMLATDPSMVRLKQLQSARKPGAADGVYGGDPRKSSAALGRLGADAQVAAAVQAIRRATAHRPRQRV